MKVTDKETVFTGSYLRVVTRHIITDKGKEGVWEMVERTNTNERIGAVVIVPLTKNKELILEKNWRIPVEAPVIQFPAGLTDVEGESEEETAKRELLEETGYMAGELIPIMPAPECPSLTPTQVNHFFAPNVEYVGKEKEDITEEIEVIKVPIQQVAEFLLNLPEDTELDLMVPGILWILEKKKLI